MSIVNRFRKAQDDVREDGQITIGGTAFLRSKMDRFLQVYAENLEGQLAVNPGAYSAFAKDVPAMLIRVEKAIVDGYGLSFENAPALRGTMRTLGLKNNEKALYQWLVE